MTTVAPFSCLKELIIVLGSKDLKEILSRLDQVEKKQQEIIAVQQQIMSGIYVIGQDVEQIKKGLKGPSYFG